MKIILSVLLISLVTISGIAQNLSVERDFEKKKRSFSVTRFSFGEDASSGWDYLVYRQKTSTQKIRVIWSNSTEVPTIDDYYYEAGKPVLLVKSIGKRNQIKALAKGTNLPLKTEEKFYFKDSKLVGWTENGKTISATDSRWAEKEKEVLESFNDTLETYRNYLRGEL